MGIQNVVAIVCDGKNCGKMMPSERDGLVFCGNVFPTVENPQPGQLLMAGMGSNRKAYCWTCLGKMFPAMPKATVVEKVVEKYTDPDPYYSNEPRGPRNSASGPCPPPELPRAVGVVAALCKTEE